MASLGQSLAGPRFYEMDEVRAVAIPRLRLLISLRSGSTGRKPTLTASRRSCADWSRPSIS